MASPLRFDASGDSKPVVPLVLGGGLALVGGYGFASTLRHFLVTDLLKPDDLAVTAALFVVGASLAAWGWWRRTHPSRWIELDRAARTLTLGLGGPPRVVTFDALGPLEVRKALAPSAGGGRYHRYGVWAAGLAETPLFDSGDPAKAEARRAQLEALLA